MIIRIDFEDGYVYFKDYGDTSVQIVCDDIQIQKHGNIRYVVIDN